LHVASWERRGKLHSFSNPFFEQFHRLLIERSFEGGAIELLCARAGSRLLGYLYNFRYKGSVYAYQSGFAYDERGARPGAVTHALAIRDAYRSGAAVYDFLAGRNRLKQDFSTACEPMFWDIIQQPRVAFRFEAMARVLKQGASTYFWPSAKLLKLRGWRHRVLHTGYQARKMSSSARSSDIQR
jgi:CelD/BcsL family acetyltransferase involved in cellulose biosynthesis